jgi:hypothetical protein
MNVNFVQLLEHGLGVRVVFVEDRLAHGVPPEPVLNDVVEWNVKVAILLCDGFELQLRIVPVLALPKAVRPLAEQRSLAGQFAIGGNDPVKIGAVEEIVVD